jgi:hypothetical protein
MGIVKRSYNPGLWTSLLFLLPFGSFTLVAITRATNAGILQQTIGLGFAILIHVVLVIYIRKQLSNSEV